MDGSNGGEGHRRPRLVLFYAEAALAAELVQRLPSERYDVISVP